MNYLKKIILIQLVVGAFIQVYASERFIDIPYLYNFQSPYVLDTNDFSLTIGHRSNVRAEDNMLGLDSGANISLGFDYGLPYYSNVGIRRSSTRRIYDFHVKTLISELFYKGKCPINHAVTISASTPRSDGFENDLKVNLEFLSSKLLLNKKLELLVPLYATFFSNDTKNTAITTGDDHTVAAGIGARYLIIDNMSVIGEFAYPVWGYKTEAYYLDNDDWLPYFAASVQYSPFDGHNLQLGVSNASGMQQEEFIGGGGKDLQIGLTVSIIFY
jgi:hypothetical protein